MVQTQNTTSDTRIPDPIIRARREGRARTIGIGEMCVSTNPADVLVTYSLGSCVGLALHDPTRNVGGLIHCMLPLSRMSPEKAQNRPCMFVDTGVVNLLQNVFEAGATRRNVVARVAGGAHMLDRKQTFRIGKRNFAVLRKVLWKNDILIDSHDLGGTVSRTMFFHVGTGDVVIKTGGEMKLL